MLSVRVDFASIIEENVYLISCADPEIQIPPVSSESQN